MLADFLVNVLRQDEETWTNICHFKVAEVLQIQNLLENIIYSLVTRRRKTGNRINQTTNGPDFYVSGGIRTVCGDAPSQSVRKYDLYDNPGLY